MTAIRLGACLALMLLVALTAEPQEQSPAVALRAVKYSGLAETVAQLRGKVVVVDLWAFFCARASKDFPTWSNGTGSTRARVLRPFRSASTRPRIAARRSSSS